jgi:hypothetical protein
MDAPASFEFAKEMTTQMITLSTAVIGVSATFAKDIAPGITRGKRICLYLSWAAFLVSILMGIITLGSLTGVLAKTTPIKPDSVYDESIRLKSVAQALFFLGGILLLMLDAIFSRRKDSAHPTTTVAKP